MRNETKNGVVEMHKREVGVVFGYSKFEPGLLGVFFGTAECSISEKMVVNEIVVIK